MLVFGEALTENRRLAMSERGQRSECRLLATRPGEPRCRTGRHDPMPVIPAGISITAMDLPCRATGATSP